MRYLAQRYSMPCKEVGGLLTDIGTEELGHLEIICAMVYQLTRNLTPEQAKTAGFDAYYIDHTTGLWPAAAAGIPFNACEFQSKGDAVTDIFEDLAAEQKARVVYENLIRVIDDPDVLAPLKFLRAREIVHFQRFGEALEKVKEKLDPSNYYYFLIRVIDDPDVLAPLKFLRAREIVHFQRFGEALEKVKEKLDPSNYYYFNPEFDKKLLRS